eukprot:697572-Prorocentrum_minimum.AAC.1
MFDSAVVERNLEITLSLRWGENRQRLVYWLEYLEKATGSLKTLDRANLANQTQKKCTGRRTPGSWIRRKKTRGKTAQISSPRPRKSPSFMHHSKCAVTTTIASTNEFMGVTS